MSNTQAASLASQEADTESGPAEACADAAGDGCPNAALRGAGRPKHGDVEARTQHLLAVAAGLFLQHGYGKVSLETIARDAHVAVRTIYVKFGGKVGLFNAVINTERQRFFDGLTDMDDDQRPLATILTDFSVRFLNLIMKPHTIRIQRIVAAEAGANPELARTFYEAGPAQTRELLKRFFSRPDIRAQFRDELPVELLAIHLKECLVGDSVMRLLLEPAPMTAAEIDARVRLGLDLFLHATLKR